MELLDEARCLEAVGELHCAVDFVRWGASALADAGVILGHGTDNCVDEALVLVLHALSLPHGTPDSVLAGRLLETEKENIVELLRRRINERLPAPYLTGEAWFAGHRFLCDDRALVPRSPLAEHIERCFEPWLTPEQVRRIADIGTGGGCLAIALAHAFPQARVDAVDNCPRALSLAAENVRMHAMGDRVNLYEGHLFEPLHYDPYDLIVSNPPYVPQADVAGAGAEFQHEPRHALAAGSDGLDVVRSIMADAGCYLDPEGALVLEVGANWPAFAAAFVGLQFRWLDNTRGGEGIVLLGWDELGRGMNWIE
ncbi:MAG: 50S ribosomal protein L3 N(5)-glutamine methyltransferase [Gammaproteobacteria bacterium]|nr:50S ribosomal protein L3 N(5)-glutamine methyltransferase [Gammaproteobacteria bacterium]